MPLVKLVEPLGEVAEAFDWTEFLIMGGSSVGIGLIGITLAVMMYRTKAIDPAAIADKHPAPVQALQKQVVSGRDQRCGVRPGQP
jgi:hypothetical protein